MLEQLRKFLDSQLERINDDQNHESERGFQLATAALLIEMTRADFTVHQEELDAVSAAIRAAFDLNAEEAQSLLSLAEKEVDHAVSLHEFTSVLTTALDPQQKRYMIEQLWRVAYADGRLDKYEDYFVRKIADLLHVRHSEFIKAKLRVVKSLGLAV